jgi:hypothetical protein
MKGWAHRTYGRASDPIHKSHLAVLTDEYGCPKRFWYERNAIARDDAGPQSHSSGRAALGTATHEVIAKLLELGREGITLSDALRGLRVWLDRIDQETPIRWREDDASPNRLIEDRGHMVVGLMAELPRYVRRVLATEPGFIVQVGDAYWLSGHVDLVYEPTDAPGTVAMCDWKTGQQKPHAIKLEHGWEGGVYAAAVRYGLFRDRSGLTRRELEGQLVLDAQTAEATRTMPVPTWGAWPSRIYQVHLADYVPYLKPSSGRWIERPEDMRVFGMDVPAQRKFAVGERRGGAWMPVAIRETDVPRLVSRLRSAVGMVRMGCFVERIDEHCERCSFKGPCLTSGYDVTSAEDKAALAAIYKLESEDPA